MSKSSVPGVKTPPNLFSLSIILAVAYWLFESCMHAFVWQTGPLNITILAMSDSGELEMRLVIAALLIGSGWFGQHLISKQVENSLTIARLNRLLQFTSFINQSITRKKDRETLFDDACRAAVEIGGFRFAWIGRYNARKATLEAISIASCSEPCLLDVQAAGLGKNGAHCAMALAAATGREPTTCATLKAHDCKAAWKEPLQKHGCQSAAAFPLTIEEENIGSFVVYAGVEGFFHEQELNILNEAAGDISYTLSKLKMDEDREKHATELCQRINELERFQKATIEREFRVKALRDELDKLKGDKKSGDPGKSEI
ncbi:MAG: hypothetical protein AUJ58_00835 [Zetaproteobacteria bacterium CG1_02_55_237]|nr:MAG: hypothetical protein AUJ58_00835 [Zetaproteobacteria bacterium CG1_02_55_237]